MNICVQDAQVVATVGYCILCTLASQLLSFFGLLSSEYYSPQDCSLRQFQSDWWRDGSDSIPLSCCFVPVCHSIYPHTNTGFIPFGTVFVLHSLLSLLAFMEYTQTTFSTCPESYL